MTNDKKKSKRAAERAQKTHAAKCFARIAALNELIEKGGAQAKDAATAKVNLANQFEWLVFPPPNHHSSRPTTAAFYRFRGRLNSNVEWRFDR